jgi:putative tryptophan/tyrosine transport system substrate-binding protein
MRRREFITLIGGAAAWPSAVRGQPSAVRGQQTARRRIVGVVAGFSAAEMRPLLAAFRGKLSELGWAEGDNLSIDTRLGAGDFKRMTDDTAGLITLKPDVILAQGTPGLTAVRHYTQSVPVVFILVADPVQMGLIKSLATDGSDQKPGTAGRPRDRLYQFRVLDRRQVD